MVLAPPTISGKMYSVKWGWIVSGRSASISGVMWPAFKKNGCDAIDRIRRRTSETIRSGWNSPDTFIALTEKYVDVTELTQTIVNEYIKKILVYAPDKSSGRRQQRIRIFFNFVDEIDIPVLSEEMTPSQILCKPPLWCKIETPQWRFTL